nr:immunoglobulin heavy chain junction region [Macaca mulatta]MOW93828.1 immunoglobulin heavy chain junction region [Macaca mulatta]MOW93860.1 immunoglobulin heavy chain junction region [Macaca mulatta]MOW93915.1 immunoglobulin heavy chain junction region [Macaca mulatta]MOW93932.1 immunoglobulin heavy chain junction region [Macaca mulatta]
CATLRPPFYSGFPFDYW